MLRLTALAVCCTLALGACSPKDSASNQAQTASASAAQTEGASLTVKTARGDAKVPQNPERIAVYDLGMLDTLNKLGVKTGLSVNQNWLPYLDEYFKSTKPAGTLFEPDYEALNAYKPQLIIIGSRAAKAFDKLNEIAPTIEMTADTANLKESAKERIDALAQIFGKQAEADKLKAEIDASFEAAKTAAQGKGKGLVILVNGGKMSAFGPSSRLGGWLHKDIGVPAVDEAIPYIEASPEAAVEDPIEQFLSLDQLRELAETKRSEMMAAAKELNFVDAARLRNELQRLEEKIRLLQ